MSHHRARLLALLILLLVVPATEAENGVPLFSPFESPYTGWSNSNILSADVNDDGVLDLVGATHLGRGGLRWGRPR